MTKKQKRGKSLKKMASDILSIIREKGLTLTNVSELSNIDRSTVYLLMRPDQNLRFSTVKRFCNALDIQISFSVKDKLSDKMIKDLKDVPFNQFYTIVLYLKGYRNASCIKLAKTASMSPSWVSRLSRGSLPEISTVLRIAKALNVEIYVNYTYTTNSTRSIPKRKKRSTPKVVKKDVSKSTKKIAKVIAKTISMGYMITNFVKRKLRTKNA